MAYEKQTWDTTSFVNPTRMNHIENGIEEVDKSSYCVKSIPITASRSATATFNGTIYFMLFVYSNNEARCGVFFGRCANNAIAGSWVIPKGGNLNLEINGNAMTISSTSSVQSRADLVFLKDFEDRITSYE